MSIFDKELDEYEKLTETELEQFAIAYNDGSSWSADSPIVRALVQSVLDKEVKMGENNTEKTVAKQETGEMEKRPANGMTLSETLALGEVLYKTRYYADIQNSHQAVAKILAGRELGLGPMVSLSKVYVVGGKVAIQAELMADMIKRSGRYDYKVLELNNEKCVIQFFQGKEEIGRSSFTLEDARRAGVANGVNWQKYPRNMLFARALSNGARWYCPDAIHGAYTYEEMGLEIDASGMYLPPKPEIVVEPEVVPQQHQAEGKELTRQEMIETMKSMFGEKKMKEVKAKLKIKEKLVDISEEVWKKFVSEIEKEGEK